MNEEELKMLQMLTANFAKFNDGYHQKYILGREKNDSVTDEVLLLASLNPGVNFTNILYEAFTRKDHKAQKIK